MSAVQDQDRIRLEPGWKSRLLDAFATPSMQALRGFLLQERQRGRTIYPPARQIFAALDATAPVADAEVDAGSVERGRRLAFQGAGMRRIPACVECHGPDRSERNRMYPDIAGQHPDYLVLQLRLFARGGRGGTRYAHLMERAAAGLEPGEIRDLAAYYASLPPGS